MAAQPGKELLENISRLHTTVLGTERIKRNLSLHNAVDAVEWCRQIIQSADSSILRRGKNWYIIADGCEITVNAYSYTIITAHKLKRPSPLL